jgi:hypothetical protein
MTFNMTEFLKTNLLRGYRDGSFTEPQVNIFAANYLAKGWFTQADFDGVTYAIQTHEESVEQ